MAAQYDMSSVEMLIDKKTKWEVADNLDDNNFNGFIVDGLVNGSLKLKFVNGVTMGNNVFKNGKAQGYGYYISDKIK